MEEQNTNVRSESSHAASYDNPEPQLPHEKIGKFKASKIIAKTCWNLLKQDKEIMLFPILSFLANSVIVIIFAFLFFPFMGGDTSSASASDAGSTMGALQYLLVFLFYIASYFSLVFFEVGIVAIVNGRLNGKDLTFSDGLHAAAGILGKIFVWAVVSATVGMILRMIAERSKWVGKIVVMLLGAGWNILSYFVVPILYLENMPIQDSLKRSGLTIKKTWGETAILYVGVNFFFTILALAGIFVAVILIILMGGGFLSFMVGIALIAYILGLTIIASVFASIFKVVLYKYATTGVVPVGFTKETIELAFKQK